MNRIIKTMLTLAAVLTVASVSAQPPGGEGHEPEDRAKRMSERMAEKLDLTEAQKQQIYDLHIELAKQAEAERSEKPERGARREKGEKPSEEQIARMEEARQAMMDRHKSMMEEVDAKIKDILTPGQYEKWESEKGKGPRHGDGPRVHERGNRGPHPGDESGHGPHRPRRHDRDGKKEKSECNCEKQAE